GDLPADENDQPTHLEPNQRQDEHREGRIDRGIGGRAGHQGGEDNAGDLPQHGGGEASDDGGAQAYMGVGQEAVQEREGGAQEEQGQDVAGHEDRSGLQSGDLEEALNERGAPERRDDAEGGEHENGPDEEHAQVIGKLARQPA